jgi:uncharacterized RDD family membrane protein YckC
MEISNDARQVLEDRVFRILGETDIPESCKNEIKRELLSNYTDASAKNAQSRGALIVEITDVELALKDSEETAEIASMYMASYSSSLHRAGIISRSLAYLIDLIASTILTIIASLPFIILMGFLTPPHHGGFDIIGLFVQFFPAPMITNLSIIFLYFVIFEGYFGYTLGKWLFDLRVLRTDGERINYSEAMLRNIPKLFTPTIAADALIMLVIYRKDRQRLFDKISGTIVIHRN